MNLAIASSTRIVQHSVVASTRIRELYSTFFRVRLKGAACVACLSLFYSIRAHRYSTQTLVRGTPAVCKSEEDRETRLIVLG